MELWQAFLIAFGGNAALLLVLGFLGRSLIQQFLAKDIEGFRSRLQADSNIAIEKLRADLRQAAVEHEVRFSRLHEKRAEVLATLYGLLVEAVWEAESFANPAEFPGEPDKKQKYVTAMNAVAAYFRFFDKHRIFLPAALCDSLEAFAKALRTPMIKFSVYLKIEHPIPKTTDEMMNAWDAAWNSVKNDVPLLRAALENEMRKLLGVLPA